MNPELIRKIKDEGHHEAALARIGELMDIDLSSDAAANGEFEVLSLLIADYEKEQFPIAPPTPIEAILFRMEQAGLTQRDIAPLIGSKSKTSEVLSGKRPLTLAMIRSLHKQLDIPLESLVAEPGTKVPDEVPGLDWKRFPIKEMVAQGYVSFTGPLTKIADYAEELVRQFFNNPEGPHLMYCKKHPRLGSAVNDYSLMVWQNQVLRLAAEEKIGVPFDRAHLNDEFLAHLASLSQYATGPKLAKENLAKIGVHLIELPALKKTFLDGAAMMRNSGNPVVALTYRYARVDSFWFALFHELGHVKLHLAAGDEECSFLDDLEVPSASDLREREADEFAMKHLYSASLRSEMDRLATWNDIVACSHRHMRHPAVIAGRIRFEKNNYKLFGRIMAGQHAEHISQ